MDKLQVAIATFVSNNYGTCLQAFALKQAVIQLGYNCSVFTFRSNDIPDVRRNRIKNIISIVFKNNPIELIKFLYARKYWQLNNQNFIHFISAYINPSDGFKLSPNDIRNLLCAITGSDMVWSPEYAKSFDSYFLRWIDSERRISYAPSFGSIEACTEYRGVYKKYIEGFSRLSCRENSGCEFIKSLTGQDAKLVCDPTLLYDGSQWNEMFSIDFNECKTVLVNCFGGLQKKDSKVLYNIALNKNLEIHYLNTGIKETLNEATYDYKGYGPIQFLSLCSNSAFHIVNGYHGLLFALIYNKPFVVLHRYENDHWGAHEKRMSDLLDYLGLSDRYIKSLDEIKEEHFTLDYTETNKKIIQLRCESWQYLKESLNQYNNDEKRI